MMSSTMNVILYFEFPQPTVASSNVPSSTLTERRAQPDRQSCPSLMVMFSTQDETAPQAVRAAAPTRTRPHRARGGRSIVVKADSCDPQSAHRQYAARRINCKCGGPV